MRELCNDRAQVSTPGGLIEWTASDGRRGTLTGTGKVRSLAQVPSKAAPETAEVAPDAAAPVTAAPVTAASNKAASNKAVSTKAASIKAVSNKAASNKATSNKAASKPASIKGGVEDDGVMGMGGIFDEAPAETSDKPADSDWTEELDRKLLEWKAHNHTKPWHIIGHELGKAKEECKERFQLIKPKDWRPAYEAKQGGAGGTKKEKQENDEKKEAEKKQAEKKDDTKNKDNSWGNDNNPAGKGSDEKEWGNDEWNNNDNKSETRDNQVDEWGNEVSKGENEGGQAGEWGTWGDTNDNVGNDNTATGFNDWAGYAGNAGGTAKHSSEKASSYKPGSKKSASNKPASNKPTSDKPTSDKPPSDKPPSNKLPPDMPSIDNPPSHHPSEPSPPHPQPQVIYELQPDATFSASDLRLIARILQQDCSMVWDRVSWRFRDKTGRKLHADLFEEKITGGVEKKSEM